MFNFNEMGLGEKVILVGAGALTVGNTVMNVLNNRKIKKVNTNVLTEITDLKKSNDNISKNIDEIINKLSGNNAVENKNN